MGWTRKALDIFSGDGEVLGRSVVKWEVVMDGIMGCVGR